MQPVHEFPSQIRRYPNFDGEFGVAFVDEECRLISIPFHRIRKAYRNGALIWGGDAQ